MAENYYFESEHGTVLYPYIKRTIATTVDNELYFDTITPFGYGGPVILECKDQEKLLTEFEVNFNEYCRVKHIVAEYIKFSPWLKNHEDFAPYYTLHYHELTFYIDIRDDFFNLEFSKNTRNQVRKAIKNDVSVKLDFEGQGLEAFCALYNQMADKNEIGTYYYFDEEFLANTFKLLPGHVFQATAVYGGMPISASIFLYDQNYMHCLLVGNDYRYTSLAANTLLLSETSKWGHEQGIKELHLGGAAPESPLQRFKKGFSKNGQLDYFRGTRIRNEVIYNQLVEICGRNTAGYFPEYRRG